MNWIVDEVYRLFIGPTFAWGHLFEITFRTAFMLFYAIANVRLMDKRSMGMLSSFEIIIIVALGSAVGDPMFYREIPLIYAMVVISTIVFAERVITKASMISRFMEELINGTPVLIMHDGIIIQKAMKQQNISKEELYSILRMRGVLHVSDVEFAYLEPSGSISIIKKDGIEGSDILPPNSRLKA